MGNNFKNLGEGMVLLHPEKTASIKLDNHPILKELSLTLKDGDDYFRFDGSTKGEKIDFKPKPIVQGIGVEMPESGTAQYTDMLEKINRIKFDIVMPRRMLALRKAQVSVIKAFKSKAMKARSEGQVEGIVNYCFKEDIKDTMTKAGNANVNGVDTTTVVDKPDMF